jgi:hypothetical protein
VGSEKDQQCTYSKILKISSKLFVQNSIFVPQHGCFNAGISLDWLQCS